LNAISPTGLGLVERGICKRQLRFTAECSTFQAGPARSSHPNAAGNTGGDETNKGETARVSPCVARVTECRQFTPALILTMLKGRNELCHFHPRKFRHDNLPNFMDKILAQVPLKYFY
jgi:hypothetical protein